jgi:APA family basic amino acid/polyamine antiporter
MNLFRRKSIDQCIPDGEGTGLKRTLSAVDLTALGVGAIIGAGIFSSVGTAAAGDAGHPAAGPALMISFLVTAIACGFAALCYAELASMIPISGSAYTYAYVTLGELPAWIIGWDLILEYAVGNIAVAVSWAAYFKSFLGGFGIELPAWISTSRPIFDPLPAELAANAPHLFGFPIVFNLPAGLIVAALTVLLCIGVKESARANSIMVALKLVLVIGFIAIGAFYVKPEYWHPFAPNGVTGVLSGASLIFFSYIGFDAVSTTAEEAKNPQRDLPIGMMVSLGVCTVLYVAVTVVLTGLVPYTKLGVGDPLAAALQNANLQKLAGVLSFGAVIAMTAVLLVFQLGQPRIFMSMARDGLLPAWAAKVHPKYRTPWHTTILTGIFVGVPAMFVDINDAIEFTNIGTLFAFVIVSIGVVVLRRTDSARPRPFRCPGSPWIPLLSAVCCCVLMAYLPWVTWLRFGGWLVIGLAIYFLYGRRRAKVEKTDV